MLSVLIVNWNTKAFLRACLLSIQVHPPQQDYEVIVVDNASTDQSADMVAQEFPWVRLVASSKNTGYAAGNNLAFKEAKGDLLLTLNPDTEFLDDTLQRAADYMAIYPEVGCIGIRQIGTDGATQKSVRGFPTLIGIFGDVTGLGKLFPHSKLGSYRLSAFDYDLEQSAPQPMGTFLLFRRTALEAIGDPKSPFDESFPIFFNEVDLLYRLYKAGYPTVYVPTLKILHHGGESTKQVRKAMIWESHRSLVRFLRKHQGSPWNAPILAVVAGIVYAAAFLRAKGFHAGFRS